MAREIKFRAWDNKRKFFLSASSFGGSVTPCEDKERSVFLNHHADIIVMQFTGLQDKNGKDIYEGDIVKRQYWHNNPPSKMPTKKYIIANLPVIYERGMFTLDDREIKVSGYGTTFNNWWGENCEIIGNIYENNELLNSK